MLKHAAGKSEERGYSGSPRRLSIATVRLMDVASLRRGKSGPFGVRRGAVNFIVVMVAVLPGKRLSAAQACDSEDVSAIA
jgi:hypothetical protein